MKIAVFEARLWEKEYMLNQLVGSEVVFFDAPLKLETVDGAQDCQVVCVFIDSQITAEVLEKLPALKMIATRSTGFDHIDVKTCKEKGIVVANVPFYGENTVAEHTFALMLDISRKIHQSVEKVKKDGFSVEGATGFDLKNKVLGIVGMGHIGQHVARIANGFEMKVVAFDSKEDKKLAKQLGFTFASLEEILKTSDIISLHLPDNEHTHHIINMGNIGLIKKGAYLINTARGGLVETAALTKALADGILAGAGLDVLEEECFIKEELHLLSGDFPKTCDIKVLLQNHMLMEQDNVVITPHNAFNSKEALERIVQTTVENIKGFLQNNPLNSVA